MAEDGTVPEEKPPNELPVQAGFLDFGALSTLQVSALS